MAHNTGPHTTRKAPGEEFKRVKSSSRNSRLLLLPSFVPPAPGHSAFIPLWLGLVFPPKDHWGYPPLRDPHPRTGDGKSFPQRAREVLFSVLQAIIVSVLVAQMVKNLDPWVEEISREGNGLPLQYSCLENPVDRGAWWATVHGVAESDRTECSSINSSLWFWQGAGSDSTPRKQRNLGHYSEVPCPVCMVTALRSQGRSKMLCRW